MNRKYKKNSWVGKIYKWTKGYHHDTDSCNVKKVVFWEAPIKLLFKQRLFYFSPIEEHVGTWFIWHTAIQIYMVANWERIFIAKEATLLDVLAVVTLPFVGLITVLEALLAIILVVMAVASALKWVGARIRNKALTPVENKMRTISDPVENYLSEWWEETKNKICKPVTWVE